MPIIIVVFIAVFYFWFGEPRPARQGLKDTPQAQAEAAPDPTAGHTWDQHCRDYLAAQTGAFAPEGEISVTRLGPNAPRFIEYNLTNKDGQYQIIVSEEPPNHGETTVNWRSIEQPDGETHLFHHKNGVLSWVRARGANKSLFIERALAGVSDCEGPYIKNRMPEVIMDLQQGINH